MLRLIKIGLLLTFSLCYVDFGHDGGGFVGQIEWSLLISLSDLLDSLKIPFIDLAFIGQLLILTSIFWTRYSKALTTIGLICLGLVVLSFIILGLITNALTVASTIPFVIIAIVYISKRQLEELKDTELE